MFVVGFRNTSVGEVEAECDNGALKVIQESLLIMTPNTDAPMASTQLPQTTHCRLSHCLCHWRSKVLSMAAGDQVAMGQNQLLAPQ